MKFSYASLIATLLILKVSAQYHNDFDTSLNSREADMDESWDVYTRDAEAEAEAEAEYDDAWDLYTRDADTGYEYDQFGGYVKREAVAKNTFGSGSGGKKGKGKGKPDRFAGQMD